MSEPTPHAPCAHLRTKSMYTPRFEAPVDARLPSSTASWWCDRTTKVSGPDGGFVEPPACAPSRSCYEPAP